MIEAYYEFWVKRKMPKNGNYLPIIGSARVDDGLTKRQTLHFAGFYRIGREPNLTVLVIITFSFCYHYFQIVFSPATLYGGVITGPTRPF
jgi:hypothetical protein